METGKSQPSRDMVVRLADALTISLRERNALLVAAGFAPEFRETGLSGPQMSAVRHAIEFILRQQEPYPALVMNRHWDVLQTNQAFTQVFSQIRERPSRHNNIMRQIFDPTDMRASIVNWDEVAGELVRHLHNEVAAAPADTIARGLLEEVLAYPDVPSRWRSREPDGVPGPLLTSIFRNGDLQLRFFSTLSTFGTARDITIDELRIECMFPADEITEALCRNVALKR